MKDLEDARNVLAVQIGALDLGYVREWTEKHGSRQIFDQILAEVQDLGPPIA